MSTKMSQAQQDLEALLEALEQGAPESKLVPIIERIQGRMELLRPTSDDGCSEEKLARHLAIVHDEALSCLWQDVCGNIAFQLASLAPRLYSTAEGGTDPRVGRELEAERAGLAAEEREQLDLLTGEPTPDALISVARAGLTRWGSPSFRIYEATGLLGADQPMGVLQLLQPLTEIGDAAGFQSSALSVCAAASQAMGADRDAAVWLLKCAEEDVSAPILLPAAFLHALRAGDRNLCAQADRRLASEFGQEREDLPILAALLHRARAQTLADESPNPPGVRALAGRETRFQSTIAQRICHALS